MEQRKNKFRPAKSNINDWLLLGMEQRKNNFRPETDNKYNINKIQI